MLLTVTSLFHWQIEVNHKMNLTYSKIASFCFVHQLTHLIWNQESSELSKHIHAYKRP